jgi:hypothetical protein
MAAAVSFNNFNILKVRNLPCLSVIIYLIIVNTAFAASKKKSDIKLITTAYTQIIPEDTQYKPFMAVSFFVVKWRANTYPETFFWRGENGWLSCKIERAIKIRNGVRSVAVETDKIHKGDKLMLTPLIGGKFPMPDEIPESAKNTLYYKTGKSGWLSYPIKKISK